MPIKPSGVTGIAYAISIFIYRLPITITNLLQSLHCAPLVPGQPLHLTNISEQNLSQDELAKAIGVHAPVIGRYERNEVKPSIEVAAKIANTLAVSLDYLVGLAEYELDNDITKKILAIQALNEEDKVHVFKTIDALLRDANARKAYAK